MFTILLNHCRDFNNYKTLYSPQCLFIVLAIKSPEIQYGSGVLHFVPTCAPQIPPSLLSAPPQGAPLCVTAVQTLEKGHMRISGQHTGPSGARNMKSSAHKATGTRAHLSEIIRCLCLPGLWQVDQLCLSRRPSKSHWALIWSRLIRKPTFPQLLQTYLLNELNCLPVC